jgi:hypothetical protein
VDEQSDAVATLTPAKPKPEEVVPSKSDVGSIEEELRAAILRKLRPPE